MINPHIMTLDLGGAWHIILFTGMAATLLYMAKEKLFGPIQTYIALYCVYIIEYPARHYGEYTAIYQVQAAQTFLEVFFIPLAALYLMPYMRRILPFFVSIALACVWLKIPAFLNQTSFNTAICAAAIPFLPY